MIQAKATEYPYESNVELTANAADGWEFTGWEGDLEGTDNPQTITVDSDKNVTAIFEEIIYSVDVTLEGEGDYSIQVVNGTEREGGYLYGTELEIKITPNEEWNFVHWSGDLDGTNDPVAVTIQSDLSATANLDNSPFAGGNGSEIYPYEVSTVEQLQTINDYTTAHFIQINDIDAGETTNWNNGEGFKPIGDSIISFSGTYNGNDFTIVNLKIHRENESDIGLFGRLEGLISNVTLLNVEIKGSSRVGALVGSSTDATIQNSSSTGKLDGGSVGGLVGQLYNSVVSGCYSEVDVTGDSGFVAGLVAYAQSSQIKFSHASGNIIGTDGNIGGIVGFHLSSITKQSYFNGKVFGNSGRIGGLVGWNRGAEIYSSYASGEVSGMESVGGLVGVSSDNSFIEASYSWGEVNGKEDVGGLIGVNGSEVLNSYCDNESSAQDFCVGRGASDGVKGLTSSKMTGSSAQENMPEFDWEKTWMTVSGDYPILRWQDE